MKSISEYTVEIESAIQKLDFPGGALASLYEPIKYALSAGGKRIRPVLVIMSADAFGENPEKAISPAIGIELFHNFTLIHDDVMDKSDVRRGRPTVHKKYNSNTAILSGDTMLTLASQFISKTPDDILRQVMDSFNSMAIKVYEGQQLDMDFESRTDINAEEYIEMIKLKTGSLLGTSVKIGALIGGASEEDAQKMYDFGMMTGVAFQIQDDWLDTFGDATTFGKKIGNDIRNSKKTYLYVSAMQEGGQTTQALKEAYEIPNPELRVKTVTRLYEKLGTDEKCKKEVGNYSAKALRALNSTSLPEDKKEIFRKLAEKLIGRKK